MTRQTPAHETGLFEKFLAEGSELDNVRLQTLVGTLVACAVAALCLYEYCVVTGGIVIAPSEHALIELHNFSELQNMPTTHLRELHIPGASMREAMNRALQDAIKRHGAAQELAPNSRMKKQKT